MRELEEFNQYRKQFKPFGKLKETHIDDIIDAFESKGKFTAIFSCTRTGSGIFGLGPWIPGRIFQTVLFVEIVFVKLVKPNT